MGILDHFYPVPPVFLKTRMVAYFKFSYVMNHNTQVMQTLQGGSQAAVNPAFEDAWSSDED